MIAFGSEDTIFLGSLASYCSIHDVYEVCLVSEVPADAIVLRWRWVRRYSCETCCYSLYKPSTLNHLFIPARFSVPPVFTLIPPPVTIISSITSSPILSASILHPHDHNGFAGSTGACATHQSILLVVPSTRRMQCYIPLRYNMPSPWDTDPPCNPSNWRRVWG